MRVNPNGLERRSAMEGAKMRQQTKRRRGSKPKRKDRPTDPQALEAIEGLEAAAVVAAQYGIEIRSTRLAGRGNKLDAWVCELWTCPKFNDRDRRKRFTAAKIRACSVQLAKWYPATGLLLLAGTRSWTTNPSEMVSQVASRCQMDRVQV